MWDEVRLLHAELCESTIVYYLVLTLIYQVSSIVHTYSSSWQGSNWRGNGRPERTVGTSPPVRLTFDPLTAIAQSHALLLSAVPLQAHH